MVSLAVPAHGRTSDGLSPPEALQRLEKAGADVVGFNCARGPRTMLPLLKQVKDKVKVSHLQHCEL